MKIIYQRIITELGSNVADPNLQYKLTNFTLNFYTYFYITTIQFRHMIKV